MEDYIARPHCCLTCRHCYKTLSTDYTDYLDMETMNDCNIYIETDLDYTCKISNFTVDPWNVCNNYKNG